MTAIPYSTETCSLKPRIDALIATRNALYGAFRQLFIDNRNVWSASGLNRFVGEDLVVTNGNRSLFEWEAGLCEAMA